MDKMALLYEVGYLFINKFKYLPNILTIATKGARNPFVFKVRSKLILIINTMDVCIKTRNGKPVKLRTVKKYRPRLQKLGNNYWIKYIFMPMPNKYSLK